MIRQLPPGIPPFCRSILSCVCYIVVRANTKALKGAVKDRKLALKNCKQVFGGKKKIKKLASFCNPFKKKNKLNAKKFKKAVKKALGKCGGA